MIECAAGPVAGAPYPIGQAEQPVEDVDGGPPPGTPMWLGPEGVHWVENFGDFDLEAIRVEFKK